MPLRVAIIGSGVSGLGALWALQRTEHEVHLFEARNYVGGHTQTVPWKNLHDDGETAVDIAFTLFNRLTYPNFTAFLSHLRIPSASTRVTFGLSREGDDFAWSSTSLWTIFANGRNIFSLDIWRMLFDIWRFNLSVPAALDENYPDKYESLESYLKRNEYSASFKNNYLVPLLSSLWAVDPRHALSTPMIMLARYLWNHQLLNMFQSVEKWLAIKDGSKRYVDAILADLPGERLHTGKPVVKVCAEGSGFAVYSKDDPEPKHFDRVVMATHAPDTLRILGDDASPEEKRILGQFKVTQNCVVLHSDTSCMPQNRNAWAGWNYHSSKASSFKSTGANRVSLTSNLHGFLGYDVSKTGPILITLNPSSSLNPALVQGTFYDQHPVYDEPALLAQEEIPSLQGVRGIWFAGAWMRSGYHEDGFTTGLEAAKAIDPDLELPFLMLDWREHVPSSRTATMIAYGIGLIEIALRWLLSLLAIHTPRKMD